MKADEYIKKYGLVCANIKVAEMEHTKNFDEFYFDIKRIVESHELVERLGGLDAARNIFMYAGDGVHACRRVSQAIADVESCQ